MGPVGPMIRRTFAVVKLVGATSRSNVTSTALLVPLSTRLSDVAGLLGTLLPTKCGPGMIRGSVSWSYGSWNGTSLVGLGTLKVSLTGLPVKPSGFWSITLPGLVTVPEVVLNTSVQPTGVPPHRCLSSLPCGVRFRLATAASMRWSPLRPVPGPVNEMGGTPGWGAGGFANDWAAWWSTVVFW